MRRLRSKLQLAKYRFSVAASKNVFEGFRAVYVEADEEKEENNVLVKSIDKDSKLTKEELDPKQHLHTAGTLYRGITCKGIRRARDRASKYVCADNFKQSLQEDTWRRKTKTFT